MSPTVKVRCIGCSATKNVGPGEVPENEVPMCNTCLLPMVAISAEGLHE